MAVPNHQIIEVMRNLVDIIILMSLLQAQPRRLDPLEVMAPIKMILSHFSDQNSLNLHLNARVSVPRRKKPYHILACIHGNDSLPALSLLWKEDTQRVTLRHSGLRTWLCHCSVLGGYCGKGSILGLGTSTCHGHSQKQEGENTQIFGGSVDYKL